MGGFSKARIAHLKTGPFPGRVDPWAEDDHYFHPLHNQMIGELLVQLDEPLSARGYIAGRETSLQIVDGREPDIYVRRASRGSSQPAMDYELAVAEVLAAPLLRATDEALLDAVYIRDAQTGDLITVLEIVSPGNKARADAILAYQERRTRLYVEQSINVVEVDITCSNRRLVNTSVAKDFPYHVAIFIPNNPLWIVGIVFEEALSRIALPLRSEVVPLDLHPVYQKAYADTSTAWHIQHDNNYIEAKLPLSSLLSATQRQVVLEQVRHWQDKLAALEAEDSP